jgi:phosphatidylserine/phosphatidylglycerophosphate/cardiolipin synthase-like enzyme
MHANLATASGGQINQVFLSSANFAPKSLSLHLNWGLHIDAEEITKEFGRFFDAVWEGGFRQASLAAKRRIQGTAIELYAGTSGEAVSGAVGHLQEARRSVRFAYFALSTAARVTRALVDGVGRGVEVVGVVDGDQAFQPWNGVPSLRAAGAKVLYYPGVATGAPGRMHHKMLVVDGSVVHLSTANASDAAEQSLELGVTIRSERAAASVEREIERLSLNTF